MAKKTESLQIRLQANKEKTHADLYLFGVIGSWWDENTANDVLSELKSHNSLDSIDVYLATVGGNFFDGLPIYNLLRQHTATVTIKVIGYALSMGSVIMLAGDKIQAAQNALIMIHNAQGWVSGSSKDFRKGADMLDKHEKAVMPRYRERMNLSEDKVQALLDDETWYTADEALEAGLIDEIIDPVDLDDEDDSHPENSFQYIINNFKNPPNALIRRVENAMDQQLPWVMRMLNKAVGKPTPEINQTSDDLTDEEDEMTPEQLEELKATMKEDREAMAKSIVTGLVSALTKTSKDGGSEGDGAGDTVSKEDHAAVNAQLADMEKERDDLKAELAGLKEEDPEGTALPDNQGPVEGYGQAEYEG